MKLFGLSSGVVGVACAATLFLSAQTGTAEAGARTSQLFIIDFEGLPEGTEISTQYESLGVTFSLDGPNAVGRPIIAVEGGCMAAFGGPPKATCGGSAVDCPMASGVAGLTDSIVPTPREPNGRCPRGDAVFGQDIRLDFDPPVTSVRLFVIDIEGSEEVTVAAYDGMKLVATETHSGMDASGTGDGVSTEYFLVAVEPITSVVIDVNVGIIGYAIDFLSFTRPCAEGNCGSVVEISQESKPDADDFDDNVLGFLLAFPAVASANEFYAYDVPDGASWNGQAIDTSPDRSHLLLAETSDGLTLVIVHDRVDHDGGTAEMRFELLGDLDGATRIVEDDFRGTTRDIYTGKPGDSLFTSSHNWGFCCTDGLALSGLDGEWSMLVQFVEVDGNDKSLPIFGLNEWVAYSADGTETAMQLVEGQRVRLRAIVNCPWDCEPAPNGMVGINDFLELLAQWGGPGSCDIDGGSVGINDFLELLANWGACP